MKEHSHFYTFHEDYSLKSHKDAPNINTSCLEVGPFRSVKQYLQTANEGKIKWLLNVDLLRKI